MPKNITRKAINEEQDYELTRAEILRLHKLQFPDYPASEVELEEYELVSTQGSVARSRSFYMRYGTYTAGTLRNRFECNFVLDRDRKVLRVESARVC